MLVPGGVFVAEVPAGERLAQLGVLQTGPRSFLHRDPLTGHAIEGIALDADGWRDALAPALEAHAAPLGEVEHLVIATRAR